MPTRQAFLDQNSFELFVDFAAENHDKPQKAAALAAF